MQNFGQVSSRIVDPSGYSKCKMEFEVNFENVKYGLVKIEKESYRSISSILSENERTGVSCGDIAICFDTW